MSDLDSVPSPAPGAPAPRRRVNPWFAGVLVVTGITALLLVRRATEAAQRTGNELRACGRLFDAGTRVVQWDEPPRYDAYREGPYFEKDAPLDGKRRYGRLRGSLPEAIAARAQARGLSLADLRQVVHLFVLHYDVAGTSRQCFKILQDRRYLSVHFLLDVDGTIYQTLDLREKAHHATFANDASIGVEIAHPGCFPQPLGAPMRVWYQQDDAGWFVRFPPGIEQGIRTPGFVPRPARPEPIEGAIHGKTQWQFDYTPQQYAALARLCAALHRVFPRIRLDAPRDAEGKVRAEKLPDEELLAFDGIVGHFHVQENKVDPGPALQWERLLAEARTLHAAMPPLPEAPQ